MSVIEVLIACGVLALLGGMIAQFLSPMLRLTQEGSIKVELQQEGTLALNDVVRELQLTVSMGVSIASGLPTEPVVLATDRIDKIDDEGLPLFQPALQMFCFDPDTERLVRKTYAGPPQAPAVALPFSPVIPVRVTNKALLTTIGTTLNGTDRNLAYNVRKFAVEDQEGGRFRVALVLQKDIPNTQRKALVELTRLVFLRNS